MDQECAVDVFQIKRFNDVEVDRIATFGTLGVTGTAHWHL